MIYFLNLRSHPVGGWLDTSADIKIQLSPPATVAGFGSSLVSLNEMLPKVRGRNVLIATHGFNVNFVAGVSALSYWVSLLGLPSSWVVIGVLWPGDSIWAHGLDYPTEPKVADDAGERLAPFMDKALSEVASLSFVSHSLGARVVLQTINKMGRTAKQAILMAGAIDNNCLVGEFKAASQKVQKLSVLASKRDEVLALAFPLGNLGAGILDQGHPWYRTALGRSGPGTPYPTQFFAPFEIPEEWAFGHHDYLQIDPPYGGSPLGTVDVPTTGEWPVRDADGNAVVGWQEAWSSAYVRSRLTEP